MQIITSVKCNCQHFSNEAFSQNMSMYEVFPHNIIKKKKKKALEYHKNSHESALWLKAGLGSIGLNEDTLQKGEKNRIKYLIATYLMNSAWMFEFVI